MPMEDHRKYIRITDFLEVNYQIIQPPDGTFSTSSENISEGGICLPTDQSLQPGMILKLEIYLPQSPRPIIANAEVVWLKDSEQMELRQGARYRFVMGLKFIKIDKGDYNKVMSHIRQKTGGGK